MRAPFRSALGPAAVMGALRRSREAVSDIDGELDTVLDWLADPKVPLPVELPDRLARRAREAGEALDAPTPLREIASHPIF
jgi:hypothetical protein